MKTICYLCLLFFVTIGFSQNTLNSDGWTVFESKNASKIIYISSTEGDDTNAEIYLPDAFEIGNNPFLPNGSIKPFKTFEQARKKIKNEEATWVLFKRGDVFTESLTFFDGKSEDKPFLFSSYGIKNEMPLFINVTGLRNNRFGTLKHAAVIGLSFYAKTRNPDDPDFEGFQESGPTGVSLLCLRDNAEINNVLIEGCTFRFFKGGINLQGGNNKINNRVTDVRLRRNLVLDSYANKGHAQGMFSTRTSYIVLEENIFDHNGWYKQSYISYNDQAEGQATIFNHNTYFANTHHITFKNNSFYRPSSIGTKWTANKGEASSSNLTLVNNLFHDCEVGISLGGNKTEAPYRFKDVVVQGNVFNSGGLSRQTNRTLAWNMEINDWDNGAFRENYIVHQDSDEINNGIGIKIDGENRNLTIENNVLYGLKKTNHLSVRNYDFMSTIIKGNDFSTVDTRSKHIDFGNEFPTGNIEFKDNKYLGQTPNIRVDRITKTLDEWSNISAEDVSKSTEQPNYKDPTRSLERYIKEKLNLNSLDEFYSELRKQNIFNWRKAYTTQAINSWIKEGFEKNTSLNVGNYNYTKKKTFLKYNHGNGVFEITSNVSDKIALIEILSISGIVVKTIKNDINFNTISDLSSGLYFFKFKKEDNQVLSIERYLKN